ncbi:carboxymuconolactone decarboxylase family protein [Psittacicella gerlachiana]|uniref:Carboxymuconolactone decarboxylase-like domain-containing protein n=1 Tax=Psittacicella gerlachiana TaxID=2028574 RepID=A0A3A1YB01_9GAMM|nr:carboxymuconolactone decarboxylase family protein [Psittacicella gerlachiana]RIY34419.1 hypothetical protein CKF59_05485 [Psittacicella gerlachiana]
MPNFQTRIKAIQQLQPLSEAQLVIAPLVHFASLGKLETLKPHMVKALSLGWNLSQLQEVCLQIYPFAGFPRALNALTTLEQVAKELNLEYPQPRGKAYQQELNYYALGEQIFSTLCQIPTPEYLQNFAGIDTALKAHLFGYLFARSELSPVNRELVAVATLASLEHLEPQLRGHMQILRNLGISSKDLELYLGQIKQEVLS